MKNQDEINKYLDRINRADQHYKDSQKKYLKKQFDHLQNKQYDILNAFNELREEAREECRNKLNDK